MCPVSGCTSKIRLERDIRLDDQLAEVLREVPAEVDAVEVRKAGGSYELRQASSSPVVAIALDDSSSHILDTGTDEPPTKKVKREPVHAAHPPTPVSEVDGLMLHLSPNCASGYKGVYATKSGRFEVRLTNESVHLGTHDTALEAALVYARHVLSREAVGGEQA